LGIRNTRNKKRALEAAKARNEIATNDFDTPADEEAKKERLNVKFNLAKSASAKKYEKRKGKKEKASVGSRVLNIVFPPRQVDLAKLLPKKKACAFRVKDDLVGGGVPFQCTGTNDKSQFIKVTTVKSQMPADSPFCGTVDAAVERNKDGWCCRGCEIRLLKKACAFRENNYLVGGVVPFQCTGTNDKSNFVKVTTVKSQMPADSPFCGTVDAAVERNKDGWCCRGCEIRLLPKKACTFLVNNYLVGGVVPFQCTGTDKSQFVKVTTVKSQMPADSPFCGAVDAAVERNKDGWCCRGCKNRLVALPPPPPGRLF